MPRTKCILTLLAFLPCATAYAETPEWITVGKEGFGFHEGILNGLQIRVGPFVVKDSEILVELIGIANAEKINALQLQTRRATGIKNAFSLYNDNFSTIVFDPEWAASSPADFYLVLGHEAGHLFCGHARGLGSRNAWERELEADRFGGSTLRNLEIYHGRHLYDAVLSAASAKYPTESSRLYPPMAMRLEALKLGYQSGSPCGGLAPATQSGFVPPSRIDENSKGPNENRPRTRCRPVQTGPTSYACE